MEKMFAFVVVGKSGLDPIVKVGSDRSEVLKRALVFFERDGGALFEVENLVLDESDVSSICFVRVENGRPVEVLHDNSDDPGEGFWLASYQEI